MPSHEINDKCQRREKIMLSTKLITLMKLQKQEKRDDKKRIESKRNNRQTMPT